MVQAADSVGVNLVGVLAAVHLLLGHRQFLAAAVKAAKQTGDARIQFGIDGEVRVGLRFGIAGITARQGGQCGWIMSTTGGRVDTVGWSASVMVLRSFADKLSAGRPWPRPGVGISTRRSVDLPVIYRFAIPS
jgi:hypothetical protein